MEITKDIVEAFHFTDDELRNFLKDKIEFSGVVCGKCKLYINVPRVGKEWICFACNYT